MRDFVHKHAATVIGILSGFDRLFFRGTLRALVHPRGMLGYLAGAHIRLTEFGRHAEAVTEQVLEAARDIARRAGRPLEYVPSPKTKKDELARQIAQRDGITSGLICALTCVEPCCSYEIHRNRAAKRLELQPRVRKCLHLYHYFLHPRFGFMHVRLQTWFPLNITLCLNGREWLARTLDRAGIDYLRQENCFPWIADVDRAQELMDRQLRTAWAKSLDAFARSINPAHEKLFRACPLRYDWSLQQSEWATDVMWESPEAVEALYPRLIRHALTHFKSTHLLRFLGRRVPVSTGRINAHCEQEVCSKLETRPEGMCIRHHVNHNSLKMYDKQGSVLRIETTINNPRDFKVFRRPEGNSKAAPAWRILRKGVADIHRRARVSQACNERYLDALAAVDENTTLAELTRDLCKPVNKKGARLRALNPWAPEDRALLETVSRGEFLLNGFRNRDLQTHLFPAPGATPQDKRRRSSQVTRKLRLLRAHGLIRKVGGTHRYLVTAKGKTILAALCAAREATVRHLTKEVA
jgi:hypothetical protein